MATRVPASPSLSPGRRLFRAVPHSPSLGFRAPSSTIAAGPALAARHSKSTSDLNQGRSRYDPSRISGGTPCSRPSRGASPPPSISPRRSTIRTTMNGVDSSSASRASTPFSTNTPYAPGSNTWGASGMRSAVPSRSSAPPPRQKHSSGQLFAAAAAPRGSSAERRSPQWTANMGAFSKGSAVVALESPSNQFGSNFSSVGTQSWGGSPRSATVLTGSASRSWSQSSQGRRGDPLNPRILSAASHTMPHAEKLVQNEGLIATKSATTPNGRHEAQMASLRNSLLQHIQSVQKEITRLQMERQQQSGSNDRQRSGLSSQSNGISQAPAVTVALASPVVSSRGVSVEQERIGRELGSSRVPNRIDSTPSRIGITSKPDLVPYESVSSIVQANVDPRLPAVLCIQRFWRRKAVERKGRAAQHAPVSSRKRFVAVHHAACRIQRAWRVQYWRRRFTDYSERETGWVGTLDWLQHHNLLYGTELADPEDVRWWMLQRKGAPLDREVDPWGCTKLRDHLNKVWYGRSAEELSPEEVHALQQAEYLEAQYLEAAEYEQRYDKRMDESYFQNWSAEGNLGHGRAAVGDVYSRSYPHVTASTLRSPISAERPLDLRNAQVATVIGSAISSSVTGSANLLASSPVRKATSLSPRRAASHRPSDSELTSSRASNGHVVGVQRAIYQSPPQTYRAPRTSGPASAIAVSTGVATSLPVGSLPSATIPDGNVPAIVGGANASLRPRSPITAQRVQGSVSQPGLLSLSPNATQHSVASMQLLTPNSRHLSGSPPPSSLMGRVGGSSYGPAIR